MQHSVSMAVSDALAKLHHKLLYGLVVHAERLAGETRALGQSLASSTHADWQRLHVFLQIEVKELEDEVQLVAVGVNNIQQADNVGVVHLLEQGDLADGSRGHTLIFGFETDLLEGDNALVLCGQVAGLVHDTVGSWRVLVKNMQPSLRNRRLHTLSDLFQLLVVLHGGGLPIADVSDDKRSGVFVWPRPRWAV